MLNLLFDRAQDGLKLLNKAPNVGIVINEKSTNAGFDNGYLVFVSKGLYSVNPGGGFLQASKSEISYVFLHEYGHAVLNMRLKREFNSHLSNLFTEFEKVSQNTIANILNKKPSLSTRKFGESLSTTKEFKFYAENIASLSELYADLFAVLATDDLDIMVKALNFAKNTPDEKSRMNLRGFSSQHRVADIMYHGDVHSEYSLVRSFLGKVLASGMNLHSKKYLLQTVENKIINIINLELNNFLKLNVQEKNELLIEQLKSDSIHFNQ